MKNLILSLLISGSSIVASNILAQGCVAIRGFSTCSGELANRGSGGFQKGEWTISGNYRHFKSFRHFVGTEEQKRSEEHTSELQSRENLVCRLLLEKKKKKHESKKRDDK